MCTCNYCICICVYMYCTASCAYTYMMRYDAHCSKRSIKEMQEQCKLISWSKSKLQRLLDSRTSRVCTGICFLIQISNIFIFTINHWALPPYVLALNRKDPDFSKLEPINIPAAMGLGHWDGSFWSSWCCPFFWLDIWNLTGVQRQDV